MQSAKDRMQSAKDRAGTRPAPTSSLGDVVGMFKSVSTHEYAMNVHVHKWPPFPGKLWQRNYYERIIRNEREMNRIRHYIINNPSQWDNDVNNPNNYLTIQK
jgi:REP element-mobilizing transposase RayT